MPLIMYPVTYIELLDAYKYKVFCYCYECIFNILVEEGYTEGYVENYLKQIKE